jgi:exosortase/archaeosortase family protein
LLVPPPFEQDRTVVLALQTLTTQASSHVLDLFGIYHNVSGHMFEVNGQKLMVEQACGGVNSLLSIIACTVFFVLLVRRPRVRAILLVVSALFWVLFANVARVVLVVYLFVRGIDVTGSKQRMLLGFDVKGWDHAAIGIVLFLVALGLIWSTDRLLEALAAPVLTGPGTIQPPRVAVPESRTVSGHWTWLGYWPAGAAFGLLLGLYIAGHIITGSGFGFSLEGRKLASVEDLKKETLVDTLSSGGAKILAYQPETRGEGNEFGGNSRSWKYRQGEVEGLISVDYPFPGWHDLTRCYTSQGYKVLEEKVVPATGPNGIGYVVITLERPGYRNGFLLLTEFNGEGSFLEPRRSGSDMTFMRQSAFFNRLISRAGATKIDPPGPIYQCQLFIETYKPLSPTEQDRAQKLFLETVPKVIAGPSK